MNTEVLRNRIDFYCDRRGIGRDELVKALGICERTLERRIKNPENFKSDEWLALCRTFGVSVDFMDFQKVGYEDFPAGALSDEDLITVYDRLTDEQREHVSYVMRSFLRLNETEDAIKELFGLIIEEGERNARGK